MESWSIWPANVFPETIDNQYFILAQLLNMVILKVNEGVIICH